LFFWVKGTPYFVMQLNCSLVTTKYRYFTTWILQTVYTAYMCITTLYITILQKVHMCLTNNCQLQGHCRVNQVAHWTISSYTSRIMAILKVETDIIVNISVSPIGRAGIFVVMSAEAFRTDVNISASPIGRAGIFVVVSVEASELTLLFLSATS
jgi:hypothetical protein